MPTTAELRRTDAVPDFDCNVIECVNREDWLWRRMTGFGSSDSAGLLNHGYVDQSPLTVIDSKINPPRDKNEIKRLRIGKLMEPALRAIFSDETGMPCFPIGDFTILQHREIPWLMATLDGGTLDEVFGPGPVELKNVSNWNKSEWESSEAPLKFNIQVQHQLAVTGAKRGYLLGLIGGNEPIVKAIDRDERFIGAMIKALEKFWQYVERKELPPVDESEATARMLAQFWPEDSGATVMLPHESDEWAADIAKASEDEKNAKERKTFAGNKIKACIGEASFGVTPAGRKFSWKTQSKREYVVSASTTRVLRECGK